MKYTSEIRRILVPAPIGSDGFIALEEAMIFYKVYGSEIVMLHVVPGISVFHKMLRSSQIKKHLKKSNKRLTKFAKKYFGGEVPEFVTLKTVAGSLIQKILITSERVKCDLIIIKKRERIISRIGFLKRENADRLISASRCPAITIPGKRPRQGLRISWFQLT